MSTIAPFAPVPIYDSFSRATVTTADSERWSTTDTGTAWRNTKTTNFTISHDLSNASNPLGEGLLEVAPRLNYGTAWLSLDSAGLPHMTTAGEILLNIKVNADISNPETDFGAVLNREDGKTFYYGALHLSTGEISIGVFANGVREELATRSKTLQRNTQYWIRFQRDGSKLYLKVWQVATLEPASWSLGADEYSGTHKPSDGDVGIFYCGTADEYTLAVESAYFYTKDATNDAEAGKPVEDTFSRSINKGFGKADTGQTWIGHLGDDTRAPTTIGFVTAGSANARILNTGNYWGFVGPNTTSAIEVLSTFQMNTASTTNKVYLYFGLHGQEQFVDGVVDGTGYAARVTSGGNVLGIYKKTTFAGGWTLISSVTLGFSLIANTNYKMKFQKTGTTLRAMCWLATNTEPSAWDVSTTDASITAGGKLFLHFTQDADATRTIQWDSLSYGPLTPITGGGSITVPTTTGTLSLVSADDNINYTAYYTNDSDNDNSVVVKYRKTADTTWTTVSSPTPNTGSTPKYYAGVIPNLKSFTNYTVSVEFSDPDDVHGQNPRVGTVITTGLKSKIGNLRNSNIGTSSADFKLSYSLDTNNNATATIQKRSFGSLSQFFKHDFRVPVNGTDIAGQTGTNSSDTFVVNAAWTDVNSYIYANAGRAYYRANSVNLDNGGHRVVYDANFTGQSQMTINSKFMFPTYADGRLGFMFRHSAAAKTGYRLMITQVANKGKGVASLTRWNAGAIADGVTSDEFDIELNEFYELELRMADVSGDNVKIVYLNNEEILRWSDNTLTSPHKVGILFESNINSQLNYSNSPRLYDFSVDGRLSSGSWDSAVGMTAHSAGTAPNPEETHRYFTYSASGLSPDTFYEFRATLADSDGVSGDSTKTNTLITHGNKAYLVAGSAITARVHPTSAVITVNYLGDSDDDSALAVQYKLAHEQIWTTISPSFITVNRGTHLFRAILSGLRPSSTYEVKVTLSDPDGIEDHQDWIDFKSFTTKTVEREHDKPLKSYQWKVYDNVTGHYIETWHEGGSPKFSFEQNSGVSDLSVRLPRPVSTLNDRHTGISHQNIVDVWVTDTFEQGLGPNLLEDEDFTLGKWTFEDLPGEVEYHATQGVIGDRCIKITETGSDLHEVYSEEIYVDPLLGVNNNAPSTYKNRTDFRNRTFVFSVYGKALSADGGRLVMGVYEYGDDGTGGENQLTFSSEIAETVGNAWQKLQLVYRVTEKDTKYIRMVVRNDGPGTYWIDKGKITAKEQLLYSGHIESIVSVIEKDSEYVDVEIYGEASVLSDDYVEFLQFVEHPQARDRVYDTDGTPLNDVFDVEVQKLNYFATDPANMLKYVIDTAQAQNPKCRLYYTEDSIHNTGIPDAQYTFREKQLRAVFDQIRDLSPSGWHYIIMPDGLVVFRGPDSARTHVLRIGVEVVNYKQEFAIKDLKNSMHFKGRQDTDFSEADGYGSIKAQLDDAASIAKYGRRVQYTQDASIVDPQTATTYVEGRLEELNRPENIITCDVIDEKAIQNNNLGFRGYNIESFLPGDYVILLNPHADPNKTYWDQSEWDQDVWDYSSADALINESVPIKSITYDDATVTLHLSQRPPSFTSDFERLSRKSQQNDSEK